MAQCFCGCGQKVSFSRRGVNSSGKRVAKAADEIDLFAMQSEIEPDGLREFAGIGREMAEDLATVNHGAAEAAMRHGLKDINKWLYGVKKITVSKKPVVIASELASWGVKVSGMDDQPAEPEREGPRVRTEEEQEAARRRREEIEEIRRSYEQS